MRVEGSLIREACLAKPTINLVDGIRITIFSIHQHIHSKYQTKGRFCSFIIHQELGDNDDTSRSESVESLAQKGAAELLAFTVKDMAQSGDLIIGSKIHRMKVPFDKIEALGQSEAGDGFTSHRYDLGPVNGGDAHML